MSTVRFPTRAEIFLFATELRPTQPSVQWAPGALSPVVKRPGRKADHSPPSSAEIKNAWSYISTPPYVFLAWCLILHIDNLIFKIRCVRYFSHILYYIRNIGWSKSQATHSWHMIYLPKSFCSLKSENKKQCKIECWKCPPRSLFSSCLMQPGEEFLQWRKRFTRRDTVDLFGTGESGNVSLNSFWQVK
jgi:hypothetical protein